MFGEFIQLRRKSLELTAQQVASTVGVTRQYLSEVESGRRPGVAILFSLTELLTLDPKDWLPDLLCTETRVLTLVQIGERLLDSGHLDAAVLVGRRLVRVLRVAPRHSGKAFHLLGMVEHARGNFRRALFWFKRAERAAFRGISPATQADSLYNVAIAMRKVNVLAESTRRFERAAELYKTHGNRLRAGYSWLSQGNTLVKMGSYIEAHDSYRRAFSCLHDDKWGFDAKLGEAICIWQTRSVADGLSRLREITVPPKDLGRQAKLDHNCVFRLKPNRSFGRRRTAISAQAEH